MKRKLQKMTTALRKKIGYMEEQLERRDENGLPVEHLKREIEETYCELDRLEKLKQTTSRTGVQTNCVA